MNSHILRAKGIALAVLLCGLFLPFASAKTPIKPKQGVQAMSHTTELPGTLEYFNRPENFLADTSNLDMAIIRKSDKLKHNNTEIFMRPDGIQVEIQPDKDRDTGAIFYVMKLSRPETGYDSVYRWSDSPFTYYNYYDVRGRIIRKWIRFYGAEYGLRHHYKNGKLISTEPYGVKLAYPLEHTRAVMLKETGIDLFDRSQIIEVLTSAKMYEVTFRKRGDLSYIDSSRAYIDTKTGKIIFEAPYNVGDASYSYPGELMKQESQEYQEVENLVREKISKEADICSIYKKTRTRDRDRFFEVFVKNQSESMSNDLMSYLFDLKTGEILYQFESGSGEMAPYIPLYYEYQQHLKMEEAEKH